MLSSIGAVSDLSETVLFLFLNLFIKAIPLFYYIYRARKFAYYIIKILLGIIISRYIERLQIFKVSYLVWQAGKLIIL